MSSELARIERVDARVIWNNEAHHFTPWLAKPENLGLLSEELGIELEHEGQEQKVGLFRADIICKDTNSGGRVLIENQIERTDHKHLGQLLTYAAGLNAETIIWISTQFTEEHRAALDWLNQHTSEQVRFFGIQIELWKIANSPAAPKFHIICQPNDWGKAVQQAASSMTNSSPAEQLRIKYWSAFKEYLQENQSLLRAQKPGTNHWYTFGVGTSLAHLNALIITKENKIGAELCINSENAKLIFAELYQNKQKIEEAIGSELIWREIPDKKVSRILLFRAADAYDENDWQSQFAWLKNTLEKFDTTYRPLFANRALANLA